VEEQQQMVTTTRPTQTKAWAKAIAQPASEFPLTTLSVLEGEIPEGLRGSLYRNGPARLERGGMKMGHWFDGDGAILGVHFTPAGATGVYRYVQTAGYQAEAAADKLLYGNYGMTAPGPIWHQWQRPLKNAANTSVLALPDKLLALWEGGKPHALDLQTLQTWGEDDLSELSEGLTYSAHPKRDAKTGEIFNFGVSAGRNNILNVYKSDSTGKILKTAAIPLGSRLMIHDFVLAGQYLIFCLPPVEMQALPVLVGLSSFSDALVWRSQQATEILVLDRETLSVVSRGEAEPWYQWHFGNGGVSDDGMVTFDLVRYADFQTNQYLKEVATGETHTSAKGTLWQVKLNPKTGKIAAMEEVVDRGCEFPVVSPLEVGETWRYTYFSSHRPGVDFSQELFGAIARYDYQTDTLTTANLGENRYPMEPIYAPDAQNRDRGWIITVVYDGNTDTSEVWIFDADRLDVEPVCRLGLPKVIPFGFHGTWKPA
jgi:carotenoid cleavage dioxygenase-like enzyme